MSFGRAAGGLALGVGLATNSVDPGQALIAAGLLGVSDTEGSLIGITARFPRLQRKLRIIPSKWGRIVDPVADKIFAAAVFAGGWAGGDIPSWHGAGILATETATALATLHAKTQGLEPEVTRLGKLGMVARVMTIGLDLAASATAGSPGLSHELLTEGGNAMAVSAMALGSISCAQLFFRSKESSGG
jgi:phosphatidylglycerophosphate synthase